MRVEKYSWGTPEPSSLPPPPGTRIPVRRAAGNYRRVARRLGGFEMPRGNDDGPGTLRSWVEGWVERPTFWWLHRALRAQWRPHGGSVRARRLAGTGGRRRRALRGCDRPLRVDAGRAVDSGLRRRGDRAHAARLLRVSPRWRAVEGAGQPGDRGVCDLGDRGARVASEAPSRTSEPGGGTSGAFGTAGPFGRGIEPDRNAAGGSGRSDRPHQRGDRKGIWLQAG